MPSPPPLLLLLLVLLPVDCVVNISFCCHAADSSLQSRTDAGTASATVTACQCYRRL